MKVAIICLGRNGDLLTILPIALHHYWRGNKTTIVTCPEWALLLDGISYADVLVWPHGKYNQPEQAEKWARSLGRFDQIHIAQCYGRSHSFETESFCQEAWRLSGMLEEWGNVPLLFDRRDRQREAALIPVTDKPIILVNYSGISSPFPHSNALLDLVMPFRKTHEVIDLSTIKAHRIYDLLGLYEKAAALIAIDSGPLHLAQAVPQLPVIAMITDHPTMWHGSPERPNHRLRIRYKEFPQRQQEITDAIMGLNRVKLVHVWSKYEIRDPNARRRYEIAKKTWDLEMSDRWIERPVTDDEFSRNAKTELGEKKAVPYVNDLLQKGVDTAGESDIICWTNDDTSIPAGFTDIILREVPKYGAVWGSRREIAGNPRVLQRVEFLRGHVHPGADVFAFTKAWWRQHGSEFPPMWLSFEQFDLVLKKLIDTTGGKQLHDLCYHFSHTPDWVKNRDCPAGIWNRKEAFDWYKRKGIPWQ